MAPEVTPVETVDELLARRRGEWLAAIAAFNYELTVAAMELIDYALDLRLTVASPQV